MMVLGVAAVIAMKTTVTDGADASMFGPMVFKKSAPPRADPMLSLDHFDWGPERLAEAERSVLFAEFVEVWGRFYANDEVREARFKTFEDHLARVVSLNSGRPRVGDTAVYGITEFSDWTDDEFRATLSGGVPDQTDARLGDGACPGSTYLNMSRGCCIRTGTDPNRAWPNACNATRANAPNTPTSWDWRNYPGYISPIKNQGACGGCWGFSSVSSIETANAIAERGPAEELSVQQVLDCDGEVPGGCCGGIPMDAMRYALKLQSPIQGIELEDNDKFRCEKDGCHVCSSTCDAPCEAGGCAECKQCKVVVGQTKMSSKFKTIDGACECGYTDYEAGMKAVISKIGPAAVTVDSVPWKGYIAGIVGHHCPATINNHAVQLVGYGNETVDGELIPYWIIRNSWGPSWGEDGYIRLKYGFNTCGVASNVNYAWKY